MQSGELFQERSPAAPHGGQRVWTVSSRAPTLAPQTAHRLAGGPLMSATTEQAGSERDSADLAQFGYKQELKRGLGTFSSFAVAFSYISPSTGIFTLFALGLTTIGGVFIWSWPIVAIGQLCIALGFAELASHYPVAC